MFKVFDYDDFDSSSQNNSADLSKTRSRAVTFVVDSYKLIFFTKNKTFKISAIKKIASYAKFFGLN